jgi:alpha-D-ribose 1-methylphosphonate 5-triphosphate synthase subunit PhnH
MSAPAMNSAFASQAAFRAVMEAFARPGDIRSLDAITAPESLAPATAALVQALADYETPVWLDGMFAAAPAVAEWIRFQTGAPVVKEARDAAFALIADPLALPGVDSFALGTEDYPDRSTTVIVQVALFKGPAFTLKGPGIKDRRSLAATPLPVDFPERLRANRELFPRGIDLVLVAGTQVAALPRSVRVVMEAD